MKVLWLCNVIIPQICEKLNISSGNGGGWMNLLASMIDSRQDIELCICAPYYQGKELTKVAWGQKSVFYGFQKKYWNPTKYDASLEAVFSEILAEFKPDIVQIFGTEFPHTLSMVRAFNRPERTVLHIQGLVSVYADYYCAYLPPKICRRSTVRDFLKRDNIRGQQRGFAKRGDYEIEAIKHVNHVMGRTDWDRAHTKFINPNIKYHHVQEMMRESFYSGCWNYKQCEKHSIFISQGTYPIKGLHLMLGALKKVIQFYPDTKLYIAGANISDVNSWTKKIRMTYYQKYIISLIKQLELDKNVCFLGSLCEEDMKERYLACNVFVSPSSIENSPNSIGEALLLGVPIVASDVGGVSSLFDKSENTRIYRADDTIMLAEYICGIFSKGNMVVDEVQTEQIHSNYNPNTIMNELLSAYRDIVEA